MKIKTCENWTKTAKTWKITNENKRMTQKYFCKKKKKKKKSENYKHFWKKYRRKKIDKKEKEKDEKDWKKIKNKWGNEANIQMINYYFISLIY